MDPVAPAPEEDRPRAEVTDFSLDSPADSAVGDTPENLAATGEFSRDNRVPSNPQATLTVGDGVIREGPPPLDSLRHAVPGYEILSELGRGGMGVVYLARQVGLNRPVALKMILSGEHAGSNERDRFRREAESVAALQHPNIVQIYDIGEAQGRPYLAFEYVGGGSLANLLGGQPWAAKPAADLVEALAHAMQYAHERGIVHRDLKPANILLANADVGSAERKRDDPLFRLPSSAYRVPKITDFGLAKRVEPDSASSENRERTAPVHETRSGAVVGTPSYLAPEQAAGKNRTVGPHTDVYALGAILYELLTGRPPFRGETALDTVLQVMGDDPVPPSKLRAKLPADLETICLKCLRKDPARRYATAGDLADDLRRFQRGEAIAARPVSRWERGVKWMKRHPAATVLGTTSAIAIASLLIVSLYFNVQLRLAADETEAEARSARAAEMQAIAAKKKADEQWIEAEKQRVAAENARQEAEARKQEAERGVFALQLFKAAALGEYDPQRALRLLDDVRRCPEDLRDFTWRYIRGQCLVIEQVIGIHQGAGDRPPVAHVHHSPDGTMVATTSGVDPLVRIYDVEGRRLLFVLAGHQLAVHGVAFSPDGKTVAAAGGDNTVRLWELPAAKPKRPTQLEPSATLTGHTNTVNAVAFDAAGKTLASAGADGLIRLWDIPPRKDGQSRAQPTAAAVLKEQAGTVWALAWSEAGLFSAGSDGRVLLWKLRPGGGSAQELFRLKKQALALAVTADGEMLAAAGDAEPDEDEPIIQLYRPLIEKKAGILKGHTGLAVYDLSFAADGKRLASAGRDGTVRIWDVAQLQERAVFRPEKEPRPGNQPSIRAMRAVSFEPSGLAVVSGGQDGVVRLWNFAGQKEEAVDLSVRAPLAAAAISADGRFLAAAEKANKQVKLWALGDLKSEPPEDPSRVFRGLDQAPVCVSLSEDGSVIAAGTSSGVYFWRLSDPAADGRPVQIAKEGAVSLTLRGDHLVFVTDAGALRWLSVNTGKPKHSLTQAIGLATLATFSPDGRKLISAAGSGLHVWDAETGELLFSQLMAHYQRITAIAVRPGNTNGPWEMATGDEGGLVKVWGLRPKQKIAGQPFPPGEALEVQMRPAPAGLIDSVDALAFTADGRTLASGGIDRTVRLRDPETGQERAALVGHTDIVLLIAFRDDRVLLSVGREGVLRVWRAAK
jgi:eukaryotic-like serine/threonine-protein kinase